MERRTRITALAGALLFGVGALFVVLHSARGQVRLGRAVHIDRIVVDKSERTMEVFDQGRRIARYRISIGRGGLGPKRFEGDGRTPEGRYRIDSRHPSRFVGFLHISYPNPIDRARYRALRLRGGVPAGRGIGSAVGIHGAPGWADRLPLSRELGWTEGCIAVGRAEMRDLYRAVVANAVIEIRQ